MESPRDLATSARAVTGRWHSGCFRPWRIVQDVLEHMPTALCVVDPSGHVEFANARARQLLERPLDHVEIGAVLAPLAILNDPGSTSLDVALPSGRTATFGYAVRAIGTADAPRHIVTFQDITQLRALRDERDRLLKLAAVGSTLPTILHGLKNPLAAITVAVEVMSEELSDPEVREQLLAVLAEIRRMRLVLEGVTAIGQSVHGYGRHAIDKTVREAVAILGVRAESCGVHLRSAIEPIEPLPFVPAVISAIVFNLTVNALQACRSGDTIRIHARSDDGEFELAVSDTGQGMPADVYQRCTELFFTTKRTGSGIGLALCRQLAERAGGTLEIVSVPGFGTAITVRLPHQAPAA
jgi:signal transduction histidine kinase